MLNHRAGLRAAVLVAVAAGGVSSAAQAQYAFPPVGPDVLASPTLSMIDPEFNFAKKMLTWVDTADGNIWVADYDDQTGDFLPASGKGTLIEAGVSVGGKSPGLGFTLNGPEWAMGSPTDYVVYTRTNAKGAPNSANSLIGVAYQNADGSWTQKSLTPRGRNGPYGSLSRSGKARISYQDGQGTHYVRAVDDATSEIALPGLTAAGITPVVRFADMANVVAYQVDVNGVKQAVSYNIDNATFRQLTFDAGNKDQSWVFSAPEAGGRLALATLVDRSAIAMYLPVGDGNGGVTYEFYGSLAAPQGGQWFSLEPLVYQGHTYMLTQWSAAGSTIPTSIWLGGFDGGVPFLRQLTPDSIPSEARADAEFVPIATGVMITYSKFDTTKCTPRDPSNWLCMKGLLGLFRADTGLPAP
jgi:hypothetical protein